MKIGRRGFFKVAAIGAGAAGALGPGATATPQRARRTGPACSSTRPCASAAAPARRRAPRRTTTRPRPRATTSSTQARDDRDRLHGGEQGRGRESGSRSASACTASRRPARRPARCARWTSSPSGPVAYDASKCMGCRYCMIACPFDDPEVRVRRARAARPQVHLLCGAPGRGAQAGVHRGLPLRRAHLRAPRRAARGREDAASTRTPTSYVHHVYGEHEAGGTSWLYITDVPFEKLALRTGMPETARTRASSPARSAPRRSS